MTLDPDSPTPIYRQIATILADRIADGEPPPGRRIASETELTAEFGVSQITGRRAVGVIADAGLVERVPGRGAYVVGDRRKLRAALGAARRAGLVSLAYGPADDPAADPEPEPEPEAASG